MEDRAMIEQGEHTLPTDTAPIVETENSVSYLGVRLPKATNHEGQFVPNREAYADYDDDPELSLPLQRALAVSFLQGDPILVEGGTEVGKTTTVRKMAAELGWEVYYVNLNGATDVEDLMGRYIPNPYKTTPADPEYTFADGKVTSGLRQEEGKVKVILLDEINAAAPNVLIRLHEILDALQKGEHVVLTEDASETIPVDKNITKIVALMNPPGKGYLGREPLDPAQLRRWVYYKAPTELPKTTFTHYLNALAGMESTADDTSLNFLSTRDQTLLVEQLAEVPGFQEVWAMYAEFHTYAKRVLKERKIAADQPQPFTFGDRTEPRRVRDFILRFYNGDISETIQAALRYYYANKLESSADRDHLEQSIQGIVYKQPEHTSQRRSLNELPTDRTISAGEVSSSHETVSLETAERIMDTEFFGPEAIKKTFGVEFSSSETPSIPYSATELERARELGQFLILRTDRDHEGKPLTMQRMQQTLQELFDRERKGKVFFNTDWYKDEDFFKKGVCKPRWALVSKNVIPESTNANYLVQTEKLADYVRNQVFKGGTVPPEYEEAIREFHLQRADIEHFFTSDWQEAARRLAELKLNQLTRRAPVESVYDTLVYFQNNDKRLLQDEYDWTIGRYAVGALVLSGVFYPDGLYVNGRSPDYFNPGLGVCLSR